MDLLAYQIKTVLSKTCIGALGRRNAVRLARFVLNEARLDRPNQMDVNGEKRLQREFLRLVDGLMPVVFDIGANIGEWSTSLVCSADARALQVYALEPAPQTAATLRRRLAELSVPSSVAVHQIALSDRSGQANLHVPGRDAGTSSLVSQADDHTDREHNVVVPIATFDEFCTQHQIEFVDFAKCDVEGHDLAVLRGATRMLERQRVGIWQFEYNWRWVAARAFLRDVFVLAESYGYTLGKVTSLGIEFYERWDPELETFIENNFVLCDPNWTHRLPRISWWKQAGT